MGTKKRPGWSKAFVRELHLVEERFLEVLLSSFNIVRRNPPAASGFELHVGFSDSTPSVWDRDGVRYLRKALLSSDKWKKLQRELDTFLFRGGAGFPSPDLYSFTGDGFSFRYVSGGTLPIVRFDGDPQAREYYCLMYREVDPIGWNLVNGGSDTRDELLDPRLIIERELSEELIIADPKNERRYVFPSEGKKIRDMPVHAGARKRWDGLLQHIGLSDWPVVKVPVKWVRGPDSLRIKMNDRKAVTRDGFFLNINGADFGIEVDRVARIKLPQTAVMFFGETDHGHLLNCPIGLFDVTRFSPKTEPEALQRRTFRPDIFFFNGEHHHGEDIDKILSVDFIKQLEGRLRKDLLAKFVACLGNEARYALCPVTTRIILRHRRWEAEQNPDEFEEDSNPTEARLADGYLVADRFWVSSDYQRVVTDADKNKTWFVEPFTRMVLKVLSEDAKPAGLSSKQIYEKAKNYYDALAAEEKQKGIDLPPPPNGKSLGQYFRVKVDKKTADKTDEAKTHPIFTMITKFKGRTPRYSLKVIKRAHMR